VRERELELQRASSSSTIATYGKREESGTLESTSNAESCLDNIEAGRIRFSELSLGPVFFFGMFFFNVGVFFFKCPHPLFRAQPWAGAQFACFTGAKVQILTQKVDAAIGQRLLC
jgi:hypothetical protein